MLIYTLCLMNSEMFYCTDRKKGCFIIFMLLLDRLDSLFVLLSGSVSVLLESCKPTGLYKIKSMCKT